MLDSGFFKANFVNTILLDRYLDRKKSERLDWKGS